MRFFLAFLFFLFLTQSAGAQVLVVELNNAITPASDDIVAEALISAQLEDAQALIIILNTPGGRLEETQRIIEHIENSPVPVIGYVYPSGATAWSAGTFILLATDIAAMAPNTIIGSAQPVEITPEGMRPVQDEKIINAVVALAEERARRHGRNVSAAREFITENLNLNAEEAKDANVIEVVSPGIEELLIEVDGMTAKGKVLNTSGAGITYFSPSLRLLILDLLSNPILASLLLLVGIYSLVFGLTSPGYGAEIFGVISISLGLIGLGFSVNIAAIFLIILGMALLILELYTPEFGLIGFAGIACIVLGSVLLVPIGYPGLYSPEFQRTLLISLLAPAVVIGGFLTFAIYKMLKIRAKKPEVGDIIGDTAETIDPLIPGATGYVRYQGEYWRARPHEDERIEPGTKVVIVGKDGTVLIVRPVL
ncbi:membrane-bound serine protease (ClpP class) [Candidatus Methanoperedens nitroreducens]|uniref:Membrane-bound serine protease (ClpP class) n=1 Tax=Candidatus Methanoperedens nitratireducens TaxID=1392998 RepID=A0A062V256_9EURY|nr:nodulation protein NfeD [Candidatus Methanoperedens nitroreducens]KCZ73196.1 membrane-bound serine protease (ClpP class) [Candidatus Methanoperedens nitroreducens]MDJ1422855.1 nodulation protein NfeD [Candidatus Methanoperedens sp.]